MSIWHLSRYLRSTFFLFFLTEILRRQYIYIYISFNNISFDNILAFGRLVIHTCVVYKVNSPCFVSFRPHSNLRYRKTNKTINKYRRRRCLLQNFSTNDDAQEKIYNYPHHLQNQSTIHPRNQPTNQPDTTKQDISMVFRIDWRGPSVLWNLTFSPPTLFLQYIFGCRLWCEEICVSWRPPLSLFFIGCMWT